jgi:hypothetical protein
MIWLEGQINMRENETLQGLFVTQIVTFKTKFIRLMAPTSDDKQF